MNQGENGEEERTKEKRKKTQKRKEKPPANNIWNRTSNMLVSQKVL